MGSKKITKNDLVEAIYQDANCEKRLVQTVVDMLFSELKAFLKEGNTVELRGFGTFESRLRKGRAKARNPKSGEVLSVPPHYVAVFRAGSDLKDALWNLPVDGSCS